MDGIVDVTYYRSVCIHSVTHCCHCSLQLLEFNRGNITALKYLKMTPNIWNSPLIYLNTAVMFVVPKHDGLKMATHTNQTTTTNRLN